MATTDFLTAEELLKFLTKEFGITYSKFTLNAWRSKGGGPNFIRVGGKRILYPLADAKKWVENTKSNKNAAPKKAKKRRKQKRQYHKSVLNK